MREFPGAGDAIDAVRESIDKYQEGLRALPAHIAVIDRTGAILLVNKAWMDFALANGCDPESGVAVGVNYLEVCIGAAASGDATAKAALDGLKAVLAGTLPLFSMEYPCDSPQQPRWFVMEAAALDPEQQAGAIVSHQDVTARKRAELALAASDTRFRAMFEHAAVGIAEVGADGRWLRANAALLRILGRARDDLLATTAQGLTHVEDLDGEAAHLEVLRSGGAESCMMEKRLRRGDGGWVWTATSYSCLRKPDGSVDYFLAVVEDISERKLAEDRQLTMMRELAHRGKNLLAVIQSIAQRSLTDDRPIAETRAAFIGRLCALSATYGVLSDGAFDGANLATLLENELAAFGARARLQGPNVILTVKAAQTFGLIAHELATNAAKYGALSVPDGVLRVNWEIVGHGDGARIDFDWREEGGPPCVAPGRSGFGTTILTRIAGLEFDCAPQLVYGEQGLRYRLSAPLERLGAEVAASPVRRNLKNDIVCALYDQWARLRGPHGELPQLGAFDWSRFAATGALTFATISPEKELRFVEVGRNLIDELGRPLAAQDIVGGETAGLAEIYQRCAEKAEPCHEFLRFDFGDGDPLTFERLLVPFSAQGGGTATHVVGIALYDGNTRPQA